jgi:hypothetical protein
MKPLIKLLLVVMIVCITQAAVFYVDPNVPDGTRAKAAGTPYAPYATIQEAADRLVAGDQVFLRDGWYFQDAVITASGTPDNRIVIRAENLKQAVIAGKLVIKGNYVRIEGLHIDGGPRPPGPRRLPEPWNCREPMRTLSGRLFRM